MKLKFFSFVGYFFQRTFSNPELANKFIKARPPPQVWIQPVTYTLSDKKRHAVDVGKPGDAKKRRK